MNTEAATLHRLSLRFADAALEAAYLQAQEDKARRPRRMAALVAGLAVATTWALSGWEIQPVPMDQDHIAELSSAFVAFAALAFWFEGRNQARRWRRVFNALYFLLLPAFVIGAASLLPPASLAISGVALMLVHTFNVYGILRLRFPAATAGGWFTAAAYLTFLLTNGTLAPDVVLRHAFWLVSANLFGMFMGYQLDLFARREFAAMASLAAERERSERLLLNILPVSIAARLKHSDAAIADHSDDVTVLFADIVGFTPLSARMTPQALVQLLDRIFSAFDDLAATHGLEKIKTIGDCYMAAAGLPERRVDHAQAAARLARGMLDAMAGISAETGEALSLRIGLNSGPVVAGVIGRRKFTYDLWGDTVNTASRMESHGVPGTIHCTAATAALLRPDFRLEGRGAIDVDGKGEMRTFFLARTDEKVENPVAGPA